MFDASALKDGDYTFALVPDEAARTAAKKRKQAAMAKRIEAKTTARFSDAEQRLAEILPAEFSAGESWHIMSNGDIDALSFARHVLKSSSWDYLLLSSWTVSMSAIEDFQAWVSAGKLHRIDAYVGEIMATDREKQLQQLTAVCAATDGRTLFFRNHAKVWVFLAKNDGLVIETSANANMNKRSEQTVITRSLELAEFYRTQFDRIVEDKRNKFPDWTPWQADHENRPR